MTRATLITSLLCASLWLPAPTQAGPLRYAEDRAPPIVNPLFTTTMSEARLDELVFEGLFTDDASLRSVPSLAETYAVDTDGMGMSLVLRQNVRWHDDKPFSSADVAFTIRAMQDAATASTEAGRAAWIASVETPTPLTVVLKFVAPELEPQDKLHFRILPAHAFASLPVRRSDGFRQKPIGTGPWMVSSFNPDNSITLKRFEAWRGEAQIDEIAMREVSDKNYQAKLLVYDSIEVLVRVLPRDLAMLQARRGVDLVPYQTNSWWFLGFNLARAPYSDARVREAISLLVDVPSLLAPIGSGARISGPFVPSSPYYNHSVPLTATDAARAATLLSEAGYVFDGRRWMGRNGQPLTLKVSAQSQLETAQDVVINLQSQLQQHGITVAADFLAPVDWKIEVWSEHAYDVVLSQWSFDRNEDIWEQFHSKGHRNFVGYADAEVDQKLDEARVTLDPQRKKALLREVHARIAETRPMLFLWTLDSYAAMTAKVHNASVHPFYFFTWADRWSVE